MALTHLRSGSWRESLLVGRVRAELSKGPAFPLTRMRKFVQSNSKLIHNRLFPSLPHLFSIKIMTAILGMSQGSFLSRDLSPLNPLSPLFIVLFHFLTCLRRNSHSNSYHLLVIFCVSGTLFHLNLVTSLSGTITSPILDDKTEA